ncbi:MAG: FGGY family carbohydrate kinase [bacterium]|nr:FGGY family carbohydrate kinase [bacterium]
MKSVLAIDNGSSGIRAMLFNHGGEIVARHYAKTPPILPEPGAVEHDPEVLWQALLTVVRGVLEDRPAEEIAAMGITNQRGSFCLWEKETGRPITNFISWADVRGGDVAVAMNRNRWWRALKAISRVLGPITRSKMLMTTAMVSFTTDHATVRLKWFLDRNPEIQQRCERGEILFGTLDTWFIYKLTGGKEHLSDYGNAAATGMFNPFQLRWNDVIGKLFDIPLEMFPDVRDTNGDFGVTDPALFGGAKIPIRASAGDQMAALFGQQCFAPGDVKISQGSGAFVDMTVGPKPRLSRRGLLPLIAWSLDGQPTYMLEGYVATAGTLVDWLGHGLGLSDTPAVLNELAAQTEDTEGVFFFPTPSGIRFPYYNPKARASILGLSLATSRRHVARAVLEGIALRLHEILDGMQQDTGIRLQSVKVDGGVSQSDILLQTLANFASVTVERAPEADMTATGAAYFAGLAVGFWKSIDELPKMPGYTVFTPAIDEQTRARKVKEWRRALQHVLKIT